jgi:hypothetical protein
MTSSEARREQRSVKGGVIVDYLKIIRANPSLPWAEHLSAEDLAALDQMVLPASWYPIELFQRMGVAIFKLVSREKYSVVHAFAAALADRMAKENPGMLSAQSPRDTLKKFLAIQSRLYNFKMFESEDSGPRQMALQVNARREDVGKRLLVEICCATVKRLIELSGGKNIKVNTVEAMWEGGERNRVEVAWED